MRSVSGGIDFVCLVSVYTRVYGLCEMCFFDIAPPTYYHVCLDMLGSRVALATRLICLVTMPIFRTESLGAEMYFYMNTKDL